MSSSPEELIQDFRRRVDQAIDNLDLDQKPRSLYEPIQYALGPGGKRIRPVLVMLSHSLFSNDKLAAIPVAVATEIFHTFTLLHDDIMDKAETRRGRPSVHIKWNDPVAILSGDMMMGLAYRNIHAVDSPNKDQLNLLFDDMVTELCEGQAMDGDFETRDDVVLDEYLEMISKKTGALLRFCTSAGAIVAGASQAEYNALSNFGSLIGRGFQIQDDLLDLISDDPKWGKPRGGDLLEGKKTYLTLKARELALEKDDRLLIEGFFESKGIMESEIHKFRSVFEKLGILDLARKEALDCYEAGLNELEILPKTTANTALTIITEKLRSRLR